jgi:aminopeptidase N
MVGPRDVKFWTYKDGDPYTKGALTLHSLRSTINNDKIFFDILKTFHLENIRKIVTSDDFISLVNRKTNDDYTWFFKQFLNNRKSAKFVYTLKYSTEEKTILLYYKWTHADTDFKMPIDVNIDGTITRIYPSTENQTYKLPKNSQSLTVDKLSFYHSHEELKYEDYF